MRLKGAQSAVHMPGRCTWRLAKPTQQITQGNDTWQVDRAASESEGNALPCMGVSAAM